MNLAGTYFYFVSVNLFFRILQIKPVRSTQIIVLMGVKEQCAL